MAARPQVTVQKADAAAKAELVKLPSVFLAPIRPDIVQFVHTNMRKNARQAYAVSETAGMQHSAHSWGTGRAVSRIPRVSGGGTSRAGQAAFGNMCRSGRMFNPTRTWRKWHRKINTNQKRYAVASALAASALPALVMARGHSIDQVPELPLVIENTAAIVRTKQAIAVLQGVGAYADVEKAKASRKIRRGKGKMRNRRHVQRLGPLIVHNDTAIMPAFRNLAGVDFCHVESLNLLQLAPGGHMGRFIIWTKEAFAQLDNIWGSVSRESTSKTGYTLPRPIMMNSDLTRIINSDEVQSKVNPAVTAVVRKRMKKNPLKNLGVKVRLNPYTLSLRRSELLAQERAAVHKKAKLEAARKNRKSHPAATKKANYARMNDNGLPDVVEAVVEAEEAEDEAE
jgi:large subunit ribosomal protein L4e